MILKLEKLLGRCRPIVVIYLKLLHLFSCSDDFLRKLLGKKPVLYRLEYHAADHCNLNCKGCFHFSNLVESKEFPSLEQFRLDINKLSGLFDNIGILRLMGGEPLLNPELPQIISEARKAFPKAKIHLLTNGILYMKIEGSLLKAIKTCGVEVQVSLYMPMADKKDEMEKFFRAQGIRYWISNPIMHFGKYLILEGASNPKQAISGCHASRCTFLRNGHIARCPLPFNIRHFNRRFGQDISMEHERINIHTRTAEGYDLKQKLRLPMESCRYCGKIQWAKWEKDSRNKNNAKQEDFVQCISRKSPNPSILISSHSTK